MRKHPVASYGIIREAEIADRVALEHNSCLRILGVDDMGGERTVRAKPTRLIRRAAGVQGGGSR